MLHLNLKMIQLKKSNKDIVKDKYKQNLEKFVRFMNLKPTFKAEIQGHTDSDGSSVYNQKLSQKRADAVKNKLIDLGLEKDRLSSKGYGETKPITTNKTLEGKALNRRVEAVLIK